MEGKKINRNGNLYTFIYATVLVVLVATLLALCATGLKPRQQQNIEAEAKQQILNTIGIQTTADEAQAAFERYVGERYAVSRSGAVNQQADAFYLNLKSELAKAEHEQQLPVFQATMPDGQRKYIVPVRGNGLWGEIWGYVALNDDLSTIYGIVFDHESETPGLGAEITAPAFCKQFEGKTIFEGAQLTSVAVVKGGAHPDDPHAVDAISGGTITSNGVQDMLQRSLERYSAYFSSIREQQARAAMAADTLAAADSLLQPAIEPEAMSNQH